MAKSLSQLMVQIEKLQKEAASIQSGIVERIRKEIVKHGLTAEHLFGFGGSTAASTTAKKQTPAAAVRPGAKFSDDQGNSWSGRGPKPAWLRTALESGRSIDEFTAASSAAGAPGKPKSASRSKSKIAVAGKAPKFADAAGNSWGGMGKRPGWIRSALDAGNALSDFLVSKPKAAEPAPKRAAPKKATTNTAVVKPVAKAAGKAKKAVPVKVAAASKKTVKTAVAVKKAVKKAEKKAVSPAATATKKAKAVSTRAKRGSAAVTADVVKGASEPAV